VLECLGDWEEMVHVEDCHPVGVDVCHLGPIATLTLEGEGQGEEQEGMVW